MLEGLLESPTKPNKLLFLRRQNSNRNNQTDVEPFPLFTAVETPFTSVLTTKSNLCCGSKFRLSDSQLGNLSSICSMAVWRIINRSYLKYASNQLTRRSYTQVCIASTSLTHTVKQTTNLSFFDIPNSDICTRPSNIFQNLRFLATSAQVLLILFSTVCLLLCCFCGSDEISQVVALIFSNFVYIYLWLSSSL